VNLENIRFRYKIDIAGRDGIARQRVTAFGRENIIKRNEVKLECLKRMRFVAIGVESEMAHNPKVTKLLASQVERK